MIWDLGMDMARGDNCMVSQITSVVHVGTHIDMPSHFIHAEWMAGNTVEKADLKKLVGHAWVVEVPAGSNITGAAAEIQEALGSGHATSFVLQTRLAIPCPAHRS